MPYFINWPWIVLSLYLSRFTSAFILQTKGSLQMVCTYKGLHNTEFYKSLPETLAFVPGGLQNMPYFTNRPWFVLSLYLSRFTSALIL